jgi:mannosyl-oligosaccharide alpha-1,2-mannosidase
MLGGLSSQYRKMYEDSIDVGKKYLFFRPATATAADILISGSVRAGAGKPLLNPGGQHLACFVGGMVGIGAKIFNRPEDLSTALKLTEGCIWAYQSTPTGIMPEMFQNSPCDDGTSCKWEPWRWFSTSPPEDQEIAERYQKQALEKDLVPGYVSMIDRRYLLRYASFPASLLRSVTRY